MFEASELKIYRWIRTDTAVLATNGFVADGNMFVKKVRQRLEVMQYSLGF